MNNVFNTPFEVSLRILFTLEVADDKMSADLIAVSDFITIYGRDFGISGKNLHGDNSYRFGEFGVRRELVKEAIKSLVLDALINAESTKDGFVYSIHQRSMDYTAKFENEYAQRYRELSAKVKDYLTGLSERESLRRINERSIASLQRRDLNG